MYDSLFETSPLKKEIPSTLHEDEELINQTFKEMQIQGYSALNPFMSLEGETISVQLDRTTGDFPIGQINPPSSLRVPITLQDRSIKAVIDTAAMVTVISDQIYNEMKPNPPCSKATTLQTAGKKYKSGWAYYWPGVNIVRQCHISHIGACCTDQQRHATRIRLSIEVWSPYQSQIATSCCNRSYRDENRV